MVLRLPTSLGEEEEKKRGETARGGVVKPALEESLD